MFTIQQNNERLPQQFRLLNFRHSIVSINFPLNLYSRCCMHPLDRFVRILIDIRKANLYLVNTPPPHTEFPSTIEEPNRGFRALGMSTRSQHHFHFVIFLCINKKFNNVFALVQGCEAKCDT